jgi:hypothetical protein
MLLREKTTCSFICVFAQPCTLHIIKRCSFRQLSVFILMISTSAFLNSCLSVTMIVKLLCRQQQQSSVRSSKSRQSWGRVVIASPPKISE